ncbi:MAG: tetratricopeptide repeat protein [Planctomycetaceae bacterium]
MRLVPSALGPILLAAVVSAPGQRHLRADEPPAAAPQAAEPSEPPGQADLDVAIEAKLAARTLDDYGRVLEFCKKALDKGLDEQGRRFADDLYTGTLVDRAGMLVEVIFEAAGRDPQWPRLRAFAMRDLEEILGRDPTLGQAHLMVARLESLPQGDRERAATAARRALELLGDDRSQQAQAHVVLAGIADDEAGRREHFDAAVELAPRDAEVRRSRGLFRLVEEEFNAAREDLEAAVAEEPDDASLQEALGMACAMGGKFDDARKAFDRAVELAPRSPGPLLQRARLLAVQEKFAEALSDLDLAVDLAPDDPGARLLRVRIRMQADDEQGAREDLESVLRRDPDNPGGLEMRAMLAAANQDFPAAIRDFRRLLSKRPDDVAILGQLGMLYLVADQPRKAIERFSRALELDDENFTCRRGRSDAAISIGDHEAALADLEIALALKPEDSGVLNNLAWLLATSPDENIRDGARAIELATKACEATEWRQAHIVSTLAAGYAEQGDFDNAKKYSRQAVETGGVTDEVREQLGKELASYEDNKPWRERQEAEDAVLEQPPTAEDPGKSESRPDDAPPRRPFDDT